LFSASGTLGENKKPPTHQGGGFNPPAEIYSVSFLTTHRRELSFPIKGTLALPLPGCQTRLRVVPDVGWIVSSRPPKATTIYVIAKITGETSTGPR
jgi:hypothetical protein